MFISLLLTVTGLVQADISADPSIPIDNGDTPTPPTFRQPSGRSSGRSISPSSRPSRMDMTNLTEGKPLGNSNSIKVYDEAGKPHALLDVLAGERDTVIVRGCMTCPVFLRVYPEVETMARDFTGVSFYYLYGSLAHPENNGYIQPFTIEERLLQVTDARKKLGTSVSWYCDGIDNEAKIALGNTPNGGYLFDSKGNLVLAQGWFDPEAMRTALGERHTVSALRTTVESLNLPEFDAVSSPATGVVPRVQIDERMMALQVTPLKSSEPFYVKLRAEATMDALATGNGKLYIGFHLDPIHDVHWNNLVDPVTYEFTLPEGFSISPQSGKGPTISQVTDLDPREFLLEINNWERGQSVTCTVRYFACSDTEGWCKPVQQQYEISLETDRQGGNVMTRSNRSRGGQRTSGVQRGAPSMERFDTNKDGVLTRDEMPEQMSRMFDRMDTNKDGNVDADEFATMLERRRGRTQGSPRGGRGNSPSGGR